MCSRPSRRGSSPWRRRPSRRTRDTRPSSSAGRCSPARTMTVEDALDHMELVGHDFFLFIDAETDRPSVVYRRKGWDYGVIALEGETPARQARARAAPARGAGLPDSLHRLPLVPLQAGNRPRTSGVVPWPTYSSACFASERAGSCAASRTIAEAVNHLEDDFASLTDEELKHETVELRERYAERRVARRPAARGVRRGARGRDAHARPAPLRRAAHGWRRPAPRQHRRDEDR